jgi:hypothetical protein
MNGGHGPAPKREFVVMVTMTTDTLKKLLDKVRSFFKRQRRMG